MLQPQRQLLQSHYTLSVLLLTGFAFALHLYRLGATEFWFDEAAAYFVATKDYAEIVAYLRQALGEHPPLYFMALHGWMTIAGATEFALRYFSLIFGVLFVPLISRFARREFGLEAGLGAALVAAFSPFIGVYSQEVKMYVLLPVLSLLAMATFLRGVRQNRLRDWSMLGIIAVVGIAIHYYFILVFPGQLLYFLIQARALRSRAFISWVALMCVLVLPPMIWLLLSPGPLAQVQQMIGSPRAAPFSDSVERVIQDTVWGETYGLALDIPLRLMAILSWLPVFYGLRARSAASQSDHDRFRQTRALCLTMVLGAMVGIVITPQGVIGRHIAVMVPAFLLLLVLGVTELYRRGQTRGALAFTLVLLSFGIGLQNQMAVDKGDWGAALAQLKREAQPNDALVIAQPTLWTLITYYHHRADVPVYYLPDWPGGLTPEQVVRFVQGLAPIHQRIWLGPTGARTTDPDRWMPRWLSDSSFAAQALYFRSTSFSLFVAGPMGTLSKADLGIFAERIRLNAASLSSERVKPGEPLLIHFQWQTNARIAADDLVVLKLADERGAIWAENHILPCGGNCLTSDWPVGEIIDDRQAFVIPLGTPPGHYRLLLELYNPDTRSALPVRLASATRAESRTLELSTVDVLPNTRASIPWIEHPTSVRFGTALQLAGYEGAPAEIRAGDHWPIDLIWRAEQPVGADLAVVFQWLNERAEVLSQVELPIGTRTYPASQWQAGELIRQHYDVPLPADPKGWNVKLALSVRRLNSSADTRMPPTPGTPLAYPAPADHAAYDTLVLTTVRIRQPERSFIAPLVLNPLKARLGSQFSLDGYELRRSARDKLDVSLYWHALATSQNNYKVFVHIIDADDRVLAQHDGEPSNGMRPMSTWLPGEHVKDDHRIGLGGQVPPGTYRLEVGLYDPASGERLPLFVNQVQQPDSRIILTTLRVP